MLFGFWPTQSVSDFLDIITTREEHFIFSYYFPGLSMGIIEEKAYVEGCIS